jgi:hypothetical protein
VANIHAKHRELAIQSTMRRLQNALAPENNYKVYGEVNYIDYKRIHPFDDVFPFLFKKKLSIRA